MTKDEAIKILGRLNGPRRMVLSVDETDAITTVLTHIRDTEEALEHYANEDNWTNADAVFNGGYGGERQDYYQPHGNGYDIARKALKDEAAKAGS
jgi:hypothetical protein